MPGEKKKLAPRRVRLVNSIVTEASRITPELDFCPERPTNARFPKIRRYIHYHVLHLHFSVDTVGGIVCFP